MSTYDNKEIDCNCDTANPLKRDGTSQAQRLLDALSPSYIAVDERKLDDLMLFALNYAKSLRFFDTSNSTEDDRDWTIFIQRDVTTIISEISKKDLQPFRDNFNSLLTTLEAAPTEAKLAALWKPCLDLLLLLDGWYANCDERFEPRKSFRLYFDSVFLPGYLKLLAYDLGAETALSDGVPLGVSSLSLISDWSADIPAAVPKITNIFIGDTEADQIRSASLYVKNIFEQFYNSLLSIIAKAPTYLQQSIEAFPYHKAHTGLYIAFLEIFAYLQDSMNQLTRRHLEFYFEEVLQMDKHAAEPDQVHAIFELAKNVSSYYELEEGTALNAGKDSKKAPILFDTEDTIVINKAQATQFKNVFIETDKPKTHTYTALYASPQANSSDGEGGDLDETLPQWNAFGEAQAGLETPTMPLAEIGFAFASPQLVLNEGKRTIILSVSFKTTGNAATSGLEALTHLHNIASHFSVSVTGVKKWLDLEKVKVRIAPPVGDVYTMTVKGVLESGSLPTGAYNSDAHSATLDIPASWPVLYVRLKHEAIKVAGKTYESLLYNALKDVTITKTTIQTRVNGLRTLFIQGGPTNFDPSKPFEAFGTAPVSGATFLIGSEEAFYKKLDSVSLSLEWGDISDADFSSYYNDYQTVGAITSKPQNEDFTARLDYLDQGKWHKAVVANNTPPIDLTYSNLTDNSVTTTTTLDAPVDSIDLNLFEADATNSIKISLSRKDAGLFQDDRNAELDPLDTYSTTTQRGYIRLVLGSQDFLHNKYAEALMRSALTTATSNDDPKPLFSIQPPYTPKVKSISLDYHSTQELDSTDELFIVHPFGYQQADSITGSALIPRFEIFEEDENRNAEQEAMFFIGLENAEPGLSVSMLMQVVEDSGNPDVETPTVSWSYLRDNTWVKLEQSQVVKDTTRGFVTSGIVKLALPDDATNDNTILPAGLHWFCASVEKNSSALCKLLSVQTQAVLAKFTPSETNDLTRLSEPLEAGTVKKLDTPLGQIKKVSQPYASFGGRTKEEGNDYYRRVSERLRHKQRAVTIWDYERLVLENFPSIYKTKCINHTANVLPSGSASGCYTELGPGYVCLIVLSNLRNQNQVNPLQPSTSVGKRSEIKDFLLKRSSRFVQLEVINPAYEEIQVDFGVKFLDKYEADKGYYRTKLIDDIKKFLSPWAYDEGADIIFGGKIHRSYIIDFVEERDYVDYVDQFKLYKKVAGTPEYVEVVEASSAKSILVSAETHLLTDVIEEDK